MRVLLLGRPPGQDWFGDGNLDVVVCGNQVPSASWYKALPVPDITDLEQVLYALTHAGEGAFDAVYCDYEHAMVNAAVVALHVGAASALSLSTALLGRDKLAQKRVAAAAGLPTAMVDMVPMNAHERAAFHPSAPYPVVVKPVFGSAARGVRLVDSAAELGPALAALTQWEPALCEEYVEGVEYHLDAAVCGGRLVLLSVGRYLTNVLATTRKRPLGSVVLPVRDNEELYGRAEYLVRCSLAAFGLTDGVVHMEAFDTPTGLVFSECGLRRGGATVPEAVSAATGLDYRRTSCLAGLGMLPEAPFVRPHQAAAWLLLKLEPGVLKRLPEDQDLAAVPYAQFLSLRRELVGKNTPATEGVYESVGAVLVTAPDANTAVARVGQAVKVFQDHVIVAPRPVRP